MVQETRTIRKELPLILERLGKETGKPATIIDAGAGDLHWLRRTKIDKSVYRGYDVCTRKNWPELRKAGWQLEQADFRTAEVGRATLVLCRDVMIHLPNDTCLEIIEKARQVGDYLLATTNVLAPSELLSVASEPSFDNFARMESPTTKHAELDLREAPFGLGEPIYAFGENHPGKYMGLWRLAA